MKPGNWRIRSVSVAVHWYSSAEVGVLQRVLILRGGELAADADDRRILHVRP
jgi:hypothetical protein